ncbi:hypothetical protein DUNSADRAFT_5669, partial [Dunaliella salina]
MHAQEEYVALACASGEWVAAVRCLLSLGKRQHLARATRITMSADGLPCAKIDLAMRLMRAIVKVNIGTGEHGRPGARDCPSDEDERSSNSTKDGSSHVLAAALLAAAPNLPPTLMMGSACQIFLSASRALITDMDSSCLANPVTDTSFQAPAEKNAWLKALSYFLDMVHRNQRLDAQHDATVQQEATATAAAEKEQAAPRGMDVAMGGMEGEAPAAAAAAAGGDAGAEDTHMAEAAGGDGEREEDRLIAAARALAGDVLPNAGAEQHAARQEASALRGKRASIPVSNHYPLTKVLDATGATDPGLFQCVEPVLHKHSETIPALSCMAIQAAFRPTLDILLTAEDLNVSDCLEVLKAVEERIAVCSDDLMPQKVQTQ